MAGEGTSSRRAARRAEALLILVALAFAAGLGVAGWFVGHEWRTSPSTSETLAAAPAGHTGAGLPAGAFGDPVKGAQLWEDKGCADCHSVNGQGGTDAPPLDYMKQHVSIQEVANMSGVIWNHLPAMLPHFEEEGIPVPTFEGDEMADLIAFLHGDQQVASASGDAAMTMTQP